MNPVRRYFILLVFFTLLFIALVAAGSYLLAAGSRQFGVAAFVFSFAAAFAQIACLALYLRARAIAQAQNARPPQSK
ncbi:hypothetical protein OP500_00800 [Kingella sp. SNUBH-2017]|uniref:Uncharacterized protein n=1 Tax=Kingella pumchi TaxID=2779506 RepID=A0ABS9NKI7_9NEIS|nr:MULTISPECIES: NGO_0222 family membrane protein [Kingella]MCG6503303.1 hypothetical protein [Kingella pumchi]MDD2181870.1 hypothetical protein [Kingella sp. SNUBH-2017]